MPVTVICPACATTLPGVPDELIGKSIKCTACGEPVPVIASASTPKAAPLPPLAPPPPSRMAKPLAQPAAPPPPPMPELMEVEVIDDEPAPVASEADEVIDVDVIDDDPTPAPVKQAATARPVPPVVSARRPKPVDEDEEPTPAPKSKRRAVDEDDEPTPAPKRRAVVEEDEAPTPAPKRKAVADEEPATPPKRKAVAASREDEDDAPKGRSRRDDDEYKPAKKKSALPLILGVLAGLVVVGGGGAVAVVMLTKQPDTAQATDTTPQNNARPTTPVPPPPTTPATFPKPPEDPPKPVDPPIKPMDPVKPVDPGTNPFNPQPKPTDPPVKPEDPPVKPVDPPKTPMTKDRVAAEVLAKLKQSTVYIEVDDVDGGGGSGSGWFGGEPGLVITNAHVLGMIYPGAKEPAKITVFTDPGVKNKQNKYEGQKVKILAVDREADLAVLQIIGEPNLPPPLPIRPSSQAHELDKLVCLGFPGGRRLSERTGSTAPPVVSVTESTLSAFRTDDGGNLSSVQLQGGIVHGNSGGPVCDLDGNVIGVAVRVDIDHRGQMTNIAEAVPSEHVTGLLAGRATEAQIGQGYVKGDRVVYPVSVRCADAMNRLRSVGVGVWVGEKGAVRPAGEQHKEAKGDVGYREVPLTYDKAKKVATGEIDFPRDADGRIYWAQAFYANALTSKRFLAGSPIPASEIPVERTPATLTPKYPIGSDLTLTVSHQLKVNEKVEQGGVEGFSRFTVSQELKLKEMVEKSKTTTAHVQLDLVMAGDGVKMEVVLPGDKSGLSKEMTDAKEAITKWGGLLSVARDGRAAGSTVNQLSMSATADAAKRDLANRLSHQWTATVAESVIKLPGKSMNAGDTWTDSPVHKFKLRPELLFGDPKGEAAATGAVKEDLTYTYLGRRDRAGRGEAVIKVDGVLRPVGSDTTTGGSVEGRVVIDERTGMVMDARITREFDLEGKTKDQTIRSTGREVVRVTREK